MKLEINRKWLIAGGALALLIVVALLAWQIDSGDDDQKAPGLSLQRCVDLWNEPGNTVPRSKVTALDTSRVSVTYPEKYGDKCLITAVNQFRDLAIQFLEAGNHGGSGYSNAGNGSASGLPRSATRWNAERDSEGYLKLAPYTAEDNQG